MSDAASRDDEVREAALAGVRVVEIATGLAAPAATRLLAEAGADVVKVESLDGDPTRERHPAAFASWNRSKRSVVLDVDSADGLEGVHTLIDLADVVVHDLPAARATALSLDTASVTERHPGVVVASVPAYPVGHPRADDDVSDSLVQAAEGLMDEQQGHREGPVFVRIPYSSWSAAYLLAAGTVARLVQRERTGLALPISTSLFQGALSAAALYWQRWERLPETLTRHTLPKIDPDAALSIFECSDHRWVQLAGAVGGWIESPPVLEALALMDRVELSEIGVTRANQEQWNEVFRQHDSEWWSAVLAEADVPCMIVRELGECFTSDQAAVNDYVVEVDDAVVGKALQAGPTVHTTPRSVVRSAAPALGASTLDDVRASWAVAPTRPVAPTALPADTRPLAGLRGLDFGTAIAGPFGAQCLSDLGVDVVKVEPLRGDRGRVLTQFAGSHRGKRAIALDLKNPASRPILDGLLERCDVVLHNMRLAPASRLGLDGPGLRATNPRIAFSHVSAYGPAGNMAALPGYDPTAQAFTGWEHAIAGEGNPPVWLRSSVFDVQAGLASAFGAVVSLFQRERTGLPGDAATSLLAVGITASSELVVDPVTGQASEIEVLDAGQHGLSDTHRIYQLADGWIAVAALAADEQAAFRDVVGAGDPADALAGRSVAATLAAMAEAGVPASPVRLDQLDAFHDNPVHHTLGVSRTLQTPGFGQIDLVGGWWDFGPAPADESVPALGQHTHEVLRELGLDTDAVESLLADGVIGVAPRVPTLSD
ncbi:CoA transferase [Aeromicrobium ginsengisoli]|uniref:CoA transferase n=1 Tax=Aeromicrobium ginsengisoli TaxID=363867 RepID=A0A5M4F941_9ACTN|nr:CoA transferase [Aeromicrobium ginsengisoli]KAA1394282.1 CoA transferase [Aeromicrobium ginsengisoli]